jgi:hypothetical protein
MEENRYSRGKIYKLVCNVTGLMYIGSTTEPTLARRLAKHKCAYKRYLRGVKNDCFTAHKIIENGNYSIILLEEVNECQTKDQLIARERHYIESLDCVNKKIEGRTPKEYYEDNKEKLNKINKEYYENNKERLNKIKKEYAEKNKETIQEYKKMYYEKNKEKVICECGGCFEKCNLNRHQQTEKHKRYFKKI